MQFLIISYSENTTGYVKPQVVIGVHPCKIGIKGSIGKKWLRTTDVKASFVISNSTGYHTFILERVGSITSLLLHYLIYSLPFFIFCTFKDNYF